MWVLRCNMKVSDHLVSSLSVLSSPLHAVYIWGISGIFGLPVLSLSYTHSSSFASFICVNVLYCETFPGETQHTHLPTPAKEPMTRPRRHSQSPTWWNNDFYWDYLGAEKTLRQLHYQGLPQHGDSSWKLETWSPLQYPQAAWPVGECPCALCRWLWSNPLPGSFAVLSLLCNLASLGGRSPVNVVSFWNFLKLFCVVCLPA